MGSCTTGMIIIITVKTHMVFPMQQALLKVVYILIDFTLTTVL